MTTDHALVQPNAQRAHRPPPICTRKPDPGAGQSSSAAVLLALQRAAGNRSVAGLVSAGGGRPVAEPPAMRRDPVPLAPSAPAAAAAPPQPSTPDDQQVIELYPIYDRTARKRVMVNSEHYEQERAALARYLRYLAKAIPEDAKQVLEEYEFEEVKEMYQEVTDALTNAGQQSHAANWPPQVTGPGSPVSSRASRSRHISGSSRRARFPTWASASD